MTGRNIRKLAVSEALEYMRHLSENQSKNGNDVENVSNNDEYVPPDEENISSDEPYLFFRYNVLAEEPLQEKKTKCK
ncbi:hypothetical protein TNCV_741851 [Trichonephila clavipes]|nr:hypothetical protein TNCV_741851 [Trichonephila clavipes]